MVLGKLEGILRPGLIAILPGKDGPVGLIDVGGNVDSRPMHLVQFARMGSIFWSCYLQKDSPKVALLNIGEEKEKGTKVVRKADETLSSSDLNYIGFIEGNNILKGMADVVVCDGFVGNVLLKALEGIGELYGSSMGPAGSRGTLSWEDFGGAILLGVDGCVVVSHGRSSPKALMSAISLAKDLAERKIVHCIKEVLKN
jgi:glycerol-3-phosphate acyltransferase PlsX